MGWFSVICPLYNQVKLIVHTSSHLNNKTDKIHRSSKFEIIIPIEGYIVFSCLLVHCGSKTFVQSKGVYPSFVKLFFIIAEKNYNIDVCEMTHSLTEDNFCSAEYSVCMVFNNVSLINVIDLRQILKMKEN